VKVSSFAIIIIIIRIRIVRIIIKRRK